MATEVCGLPRAQKECLHRIKAVSASPVPPEGDTQALDRDRYYHGPGRVHHNF